MNIFSDIDSSFGRGSEDFFTAVMASMCKRQPKLKNALISWIERSSPTLRLSHLSWTVQGAQVNRIAAKEFGNAVIDMVFEASGYELWFEHKIKSRLGKYGEKDQIDKYLDAAARYMQGVEDPHENVKWPESGRGRTGRPTVLLVVITRGLENLEHHKTRQEIQKGEGGGFVWLGDNGHLQWKDFWHEANDCLGEVLAGQQGEFEKTLATHFLEYWDSIPGMSKKEVPADWKELFPGRDSEGNFISSPLENLWSEEIRVAQDYLGFKLRQKPYEGNEHYFDLSSEKLSLITVCAKEHPVNRALGEETIEVSFTGPELEEVYRDIRKYEGKWPVLVTTTPDWKRKQNRVRVNVGIHDWKARTSEEGKSIAIKDAFVVALKVFSEETKIQFKGLELL